MITDRDLELEYLRDTGQSPKTDVYYTRGFFGWCLDQLLILKNKENEKIEPKEFHLGES